jgi:2-polyprenyl-6-hydroxyphenyl methylase/3-demethylubiquinone-9 3-methyltransferase
MGELNFSFGKNWQSFIKDYINEERIAEAKKSLLGFLGGNKIEGRTFLDIGCGSGLFSLAAYQLGAAKVLSFDLDQHSVACCKYLRQKEADPGNWQIEQGSILDKNFISALGKFDLVYSWGVLHHTGMMYEAINNTLSLVNKGGLLYIAIYNKADSFGVYPDGRFGTSDFWKKAKKIYAHSCRFIQLAVDYAVMGFLVTAYILTLKNPIKKIKSHKELRGMSWEVDIRDWLGGWPYEYACPDEIFKFVKKHGFSLENLKSNNGLRNNEFLFVKT